jgi:hypothetical protein
MVIWLFNIILFLSIGYLYKKGGVKESIGEIGWGGN